MKSKKSIILILILTYVVIHTGCGAKETANNVEEKAISVETAKVEKGSIQSEVKVNGKVKPAQEIVIMPKIAGKVTNINFDVGDNVKKGDILFILDEKDLQLQVQQAEAALNSAQVALQKASGGSVEQQLSQLRTNLSTIERNLNDAKLNFERTKGLYEAGGVSKQAYESAETSLKLLQNQYESAKTSLELTENKINAENLAAAQAGVKQAQATYDLAKSQLENSSVESPIEGIIAASNIEVGEFATNASPAMTVVDLSYVTVDINVPENIINKINLGSKVDVSVKSVSNESITGEIISISPSAGEMTQSYPVKVRIQNDNLIFKGGMFADITLNLEKIEDTIVVSLDSIVNIDGQNIVYTVQDNKAVRNVVELGLSNSDHSQILSGLDEGETIIIKGQNFVEDGNKVSIINQEQR